MIDNGRRHYPTIDMHDKQLTTRQSIGRRGLRRINTATPSDSDRARLLRIMDQIIDTTDIIKIICDSLSDNRLHFLQSAYTTKRMPPSVIEILRSR